MVDQASVATTFLVFIALFLGVGLYSSYSSKRSTSNRLAAQPSSDSSSSDYLLAGRGVNSWLTALSTVATGNSGFKFIGLVGYTYDVGIAAIWITIGFIIGDGLAWLTVHRRLRQLSEVSQSETVPAFLGQDSSDLHDRSSDVSEILASREQRGITIAVAIATLFFLSIYAAAQLHAGSKALSVLFGWDSWAGVSFGAAIVAIYCVSGGIRSSIWVGSVQAILMLVSMLSLSGVAIAACGGLGDLWHHLGAIDPSLTELMPTDFKFGFWPFAIAWTVSGFGVVGQPHLMIRAMAIESSTKISQARNIYMAFNIIFVSAATVVGLTARVLLPELVGTDTELALPKLAMTLLPGVMVGLVLVGLFSATISTADAQILACSAALSQDLRPQSQFGGLRIKVPGLGWGNDVRTGLSKSLADGLTFVLPFLPRISPLEYSQVTWAKVSTLFIIGVTWLMALMLTDNVFVLVTFSWSALASGLGPLMVLRVFKRPLSTRVAIAMMTTGIATALLWRMGLHWSQDVYEVLPGMMASVIVYLLSYGLRDRPGQSLF